MLTNVEIRNYKSLKNVRINSFKKITLLRGGNGSGKTTIIDSLCILESPDTNTILEKFTTSSNIDKLLFGNLDYPIELRDNKNRITIDNSNNEITLNDNIIDTVGDVAINSRIEYDNVELVSMLNKVTSEYLDDDLKDYLIMFDQNIFGVRVILVDGNESYIGVRLKNSNFNIPFDYLSASLKRYIYIVLKLFNSSDKTVYIDDIDLYIEQDNYPTIIKVINKLSSQLNIGIVMTCSCHEFVKKTCQMTENTLILKIEKNNTDTVVVVDDCGTEQTVDMVETKMII